jgi:hypothetical protein
MEAVQTIGKARSNIRPVESFHFTLRTRAFVAAEGVTTAELLTFRNFSASKLGITNLLIFKPVEHLFLSFLSNTPGHNAGFE